MSHSFILSFRRILERKSEEWLSFLMNDDEEKEKSERDEMGNSDLMTDSESK